MPISTWKRDCRRSESFYETVQGTGGMEDTRLRGYVAAFPFAEVISGYTAFYLGAKSVNPDVTMEIIYTNTWNDPSIESRTAQALIDRGCDVISQHSDSTAPATVAEENGVWHVGYNSDMIEAAPNASLISARIDWSVYEIEAVQDVMEGKTIPTDWCKGVKEKAVYLSTLNKTIAASGTEEAISKANEAIESGTLKIFAGPLAGESPEGEKYQVSASTWEYTVNGCTIIE